MRRERVLGGRRLQAEGPRVAADVEHGGDAGVQERAVEPFGMRLVVGHRLLVRELLAHVHRVGRP